MSNKLKEITFNVMKKLEDKDVVLPGDYSEIFKDFAEKMNLKIEDQNVLHEEIRIEHNKINKIIKHTKKNLDSLDTSTKEAKEAIINKDEEKLDEIRKDINLLQDQVQLLQKQLFTDSLTNVYNRKWLTDSFLEDNHFKNSGYFAFIDLNDFKNINDRYGHLVGDLVLKYLANYLKKEISFKDKHIVRYAGDEFIVIFNSDDSLNKFDKKMIEAQEKISKRVLKPKNAENVNLTFSFSYGLASFKRDDHLGQILELADEKMYQNKKLIKKNTGKHIFVKRS